MRFSIATVLAACTVSALAVDTNATATNQSADVKGSAFSRKHHGLVQRHNGVKHEKRVSNAQLTYYDITTGE